MTKMERLFAAIRDPRFENFELADGSIDGASASFIVAVSEDEDAEPVPVALLLDKRMLAKLEAIIEELNGPGDEDDDDEDDEEDGYEDDGAVPRSSKRWRP